MVWVYSVSKWKLGKSWKLGETYVVLVQTEEKRLDEPFHRKRTGLNHITFHVDSRKEVDGLIRELKSRGIAILYSDRYPKDDWYAMYFEDPDRIKIGVVAS